MTKKLTLLFVLLTALTYAQVPISDIRINDSTGVPQMLGQTVTVSGIVTSSNQFGSPGPASIQDNTAGMCIYGGSFPNSVNLGDSVTVTGEITQYSGLTELGSATFVLISSGHQVDPEIITTSDMVNQEWNGLEEYEGKLVRLNNITISGTGNFVGNHSYIISDITGSSNLYIDPDVSDIIGTPIPSGEIDLIGIVHQHVLLLLTVRDTKSIRVL